MILRLVKSDPDRSIVGRITCAKGSQRFESGPKATAELMAAGFVDLPGQTSRVANIAESACHCCLSTCQ